MLVLSTFWSQGFGWNTGLCECGALSYLPDLDPCDLFLFPKLKIHLKSKIWGCGGH